MNIVNTSVPKLDGMALVSGKGVYTEDLLPQSCLVVKLLRSPHAFARVQTIKTDAACRVAGIECVLTWEDVPKIRYTLAGQSYPEPSPYDRYILENVVRYVGDPVAIVAGRDEASVDKALRLIKVKYEVYTPVLDVKTALDNPIVLHPEADYHNNFSIGGDKLRNLAAGGSEEQGDLDAAFAACDLVLEETYHTKANAQAMMETFRTYTYLDYNGRLCVVSSTQVPFHCRRTIAHALGLAQNRVCVIKPRIGGGFGAKQTLVSELFPALVTLKTGKPARIIYTRQECFAASNSRHEMLVTVKMGATKDGVVRALSVYALSNAGAYGEHASTTVGLVGHKTIPLYSKALAFRFGYDVVYTNTMAAGAFRGYGATQGCFAVESTANQLAAALNICPVELRLRNIPAQGEHMPAYYGEALSSSHLEACIARGQELIGWAQKYPRKQVSPHSVRGVGMAITMQGSGISGIDTASAQIKLCDSGCYTLSIGATDMGTGCDTILAQMAAETLRCPLSLVTVDGVDTDHSPYDTGSYASSTTYVTGMAVVKACAQLMKQIRAAGAQALGLPLTSTLFDGEAVRAMGDLQHCITLDALAKGIAGGGERSMLCASATHSSPTSPPPLMAGFAEVEVDTETGKITLCDFVGVVDCGTLINPALARVQAEGGLVQGIGMALSEEIAYNARGKMVNDSLMQYKIPSRLDIPAVRVEFCSSYEPTGPFGAKSIGEVVINTPAPAIADAVFHATGVRITELPITAEKIKMALCAAEISSQVKSEKRLEPLDTL